eukprot:CAMPEP_0198287400 /NCGR_PEP_ID=MMETSP1449-20131203/6232_1 /TAXON_ID=420275 /ORGANISM="Attheya septentrionalis, Strain CCMP2084" /LENGTH=175 /DNA_ID=CAMNT_0043985351 /DNA_START=130 /DNA_END=657 /DNA_ORIENTATION=+
MTRNQQSVLLLVALSVMAVSGFAPAASRPFVVSSRAPTVVRMSDVETDVEEPKMNPDKPELPELKNDYDWDEKFGGDKDWLSENVPGKVVVGELELAAQVTALSKLEEKWRKVRVKEEYEGARLLGWSEQGEMYNGRFAMFFLVVGLLTEYWTGITFPGQIEEMLRVGGFIGFEQ